jgi:hypothetical protein
MGGLLVFLIIVTVIVINVVRSIQKASAGASGLLVLDTVASNGIPARGLILGCSSFANGVTINQRRFERRVMTLDVEVPGRPPYVTNGEYLIPRGLVQAIPGASLELAVDPTNPSNIAVLGPGGFTGPWLRVGPPQPY